jgi:4a-hydroxytetrahydrobiopterin dehydratase
MTAGKTGAIRAGRCGRWKATTVGKPVCGSIARAMGAIAMNEDLLSKTCTPCRGGIPPLTTAEAERYLAQAPGWTLVDEGRGIERTFTFGNFKEALDFVVKVGQLAESEGHHPDIGFGWGWARVSWQTKKIKGLHENDFIMAAKTTEASSAQ